MWHARALLGAAGDRAVAPFFDADMGHFDVEQHPEYPANDSAGSSTRRRPRRRRGRRAARRGRAAGRSSARELGVAKTRGAVPVAPRRPMAGASASPARAASAAGGADVWQA